MSSRFTADEVKALQVAYLSAQGKASDEISKTLQIDHQSKVSKLKRIARENGWLGQTWTCPPEIDRREIEMCGFPKLKQLESKTQELAERNGGIRPSRVHVIYSGPPECSVEERLEKYGGLAADYVAHILQDAQSCMVAWGRTIRSTVDRVSLYVRKPDCEKLFGPVAGEPLNHPDTGVSPSGAAQKLAEAFRSEDSVLSLRGVAARIPNREDIPVETIRRFYEQCKTYDKIFGGTDALIRHTDVILSGIGDVESSENDPWFRETQELEGITPDKLAEVSVGNLGGVWFSKAGSEARKKVDEINARSLGIQEDHFRLCCQRAAPSDSPRGVIVLAVGKPKAHVVARAIGLINHLIIDHSLAEELLNESADELLETHEGANRNRSHASRRKAKKSKRTAGQSSHK